MVQVDYPTPYTDVNAIVNELLRSVQSILGARLTGFYLEGSLANGGFDQDSDIDFVAVVQSEVTHEEFRALRAMHDRIATFDSPWAVQLEGSYIPEQALRRFNPEHSTFPNLERGQGERLKYVDHDAGWDIHRAILHQKGIPVYGPPPQALVDPVPPDRLRSAMRPVLEDWAGQLLAEPAHMGSSGYQSYVVLSLCRVLYTLATGAVASKQAAAGWAKETLNERWHGLIDRAWEGRHHPGLPAGQDEIERTLAFIRHVQGLARGGAQIG